MRILVTSFGAFLKNNANSSLECMNELPKTINGSDIFKCELPVSYSASRMKLLTFIQEFKPNIVVSLGLAAGRKNISLETQALNLIDSKYPDNDGNIFINKIIEKNCEKYIKSSFDLEKIKNNLSRKYPFISISNNAGTYVCNTVYFYSLSLQNEYKHKSIFVHLPTFNIISKEVMVQVLQDIITLLMENY